MSSPRTSHPAPTYSSASARAHPYGGYSHHHHHRRRSPAPVDERLPPSPPRSRREADSPPSTKPAPVDPSDNYWDDVPAPPASLKSILDSFRASGEGDRDLLLAILGAKKAEEERLTAIIQTRLTVLQARLNIATMQAQLAPPPPPMPLAHHERTPSLSHSSAASALNSPPLAEMSPPQHSGYFQGHERERILPPMSAAYGERLPPIYRDRSDSGSSRRPEGLEMLLEGVREAERKERV